MEFRIDSTYDQKALKAMAKALRKTVRRKRSRRSLVYGILVMILGVLLIASSDQFGFRQVITAVAVIAIAVALIFQDDLNGYFARKRSFPGLAQAVTIFRDEGYHTATAVGETLFPYHNIRIFVEDKHYFVFVFSPSHAQIYDKKTLQGGTQAEFIRFITGKIQAEHICIE